MDIIYCKYMHSCNYINNTIFVTFTCYSKIIFYNHFFVCLYEIQTLHKAGRVFKSHYIGRFRSSPGFLIFEKQSFIKEAPFAHRTDTIFPGNPVCSLNTCHFPPCLFFLHEHFLFLQKFLLLHRTEINFSGSLYLVIEQNGIFLERYSCRTNVSTIDDC